MRLLGGPVDAQRIRGDGGAGATVDKDATLPLPVAARAGRADQHVGETVAVDVAGAGDALAEVVGGGRAGRGIGEQRERGRRDTLAAAAIDEREAAAGRAGADHD